MSKVEPAFKFVELARADAAFEAQGRTLSELFSAAGRGLTSLMAEPSLIRGVQSRPIALTAAAGERLLFDFLQELIFLKDAEGLLFERFELSVRESPWRLEGTLYGEPIDPKRHRLGVDVKAVTLHRFGLERRRGVWHATVVLDI